MTTNKYKVALDIKYFLIGFLAFLMIATYFLLSFSKSQIHLAINGCHSGFFDFFFQYFTHLGDGATVVIIGLIAFCFRPRLGILILSSYLLSGLVAQILKRFVFDDVVRPLLYFKDVAELHLIDGVKMVSKHSFPSGHTVTAFAFFATIAFFVRNKYLQLLLFVLALLVGYSRVYLSQHFLVDITFGAIIGVITAMGCYVFIGKYHNGWLDKQFCISRKDGSKVDV